MPRALNRLNARQVATLTEKGYHADGGGLYLRIAETKTWAFRWERNKRPREMGLGPLHTVSLAMAREAATAARRIVLAGGDPIEQRRVEQATSAGVPTFEKAFAAYIETNRKGWRNPKHVDQWTNTLTTYASPFIGSKPVDQITTADMLAILTPIWTTKTETATRVRQRIEAVLDAERAKSQSDRENPARWRGHLAKLLPKPSSVSPVQHFPALPYAKLADFMEDLRAQEGEAARALEFTILTAARTSMTLEAPPSEIHGSDWVIPKLRMKAKRDHIVPMPEAAQTLIKDRRKGSLLFANLLTGDPLSENAMLALLERMGHGNITVHGFRSTFKDWASDLTDYADDLSEMALAHAIKDKTKASYQRGAMLERRRTMMEAWATYCGY